MEGELEGESTAQDNDISNKKDRWGFWNEMTKKQHSMFTGTSKDSCLVCRGLRLMGYSRNRMVELNDAIKMMFHLNVQRVHHLAAFMFGPRFICSNILMVNLSNCILLYSVVSYVKINVFEQLVSLLHCSVCTNACKSLVRPDSICPFQWCLKTILPNVICTINLGDEFM